MRALILLTPVVVLAALTAPAQAQPVYFVVSEMGAPVHGDSYVVPLTDPTDVRTARDMIRYGPGLNHIVVCEIALGADGINRDVLAPGEPLWSWHVVAFLGFAEMTEEGLDGWPGLVEQSPGAYIHDPDPTGLIGFWAYAITAELGGGPPVPPPATPTGLTLTDLRGGKVKVAWTDTSNNEQGFEVQREQKVGGSWTNTTLVATTAPNVTNITDQATAGGTFRYRVRSFNSGGSSAWTAWKQIKLR